MPSRQAGQHRARQNLPRLRPRRRDAAALARSARSRSPQMPAHARSSSRTPRRAPPAHLPRITTSADRRTARAGAAAWRSWRLAKLLLQASQTRNSARRCAMQHLHVRRRPRPRPRRRPTLTRPPRGRRRRGSTASYFTTDAMGVALGQGASEGGGACAAVVEGGAPRRRERPRQRRTPSVVAFADSGETLVGQPAKKLLFSRRRRRCAASRRSRRAPRLGRVPPPLAEVRRCRTPSPPTTAALRPCR